MRQGERKKRRAKLPIPQTPAEMKQMVEKQLRTPLDYAASARGIFYWVVGWHRGRRVILGAFSTEREAEEEGFAKLPGNYKVIPLKTRDEAKASREIRAMVLDETRDVDETFKRFRHQVV